MHRIVNCVKLLATATRAESTHFTRLKVHRMHRHVALINLKKWYNSRLRHSAAPHVSCTSVAGFCLSHCTPRNISTWYYRANANTMWRERLSLDLFYYSIVVALKRCVIIINLFACSTLHLYVVNTPWTVHRRHRRHHKEPVRITWESPQISNMWQFGLRYSIYCVRLCKSIHSRFGAHYRAVHFEANNPSIVLWPFGVIQFIVHMIQWKLWIININYNFHFGRFVVCTSFDGENERMHLYIWRLRNGSRVENPSMKPIQSGLLSFKIPMCQFI